MDIQEQIAFLEELLDSDQKYREELFAAKTEEQKQTALKLMVEQDEINLQKFIHFVETYGWPNRTVHGEKGSDVAFLIIQHSKLELMEKYLPLLKEKANQGEANPKHSGMMEDRILMWQNKKQKFGSQAMGNAKLGKSHIWPIEDVENVNSRRLEAGFNETIEEYAARADYVFDPTLKISDFS